MKQIDEDAYAEVLRELAEKKSALLKDEQWPVPKKNTIDYLIQKGYENELITATVNSIATKE